MLRTYPLAWFGSALPMSWSPALTSNERNKKGAAAGSSTRRLLYALRSKAALDYAGQINSRLASRAADAGRLKSCHAPHPGGGIGLRGAPPIETGPSGFDSRADLLRDAARPRADEIEDVVSGPIAFCSESTRAANKA